jgi:exosortase
VAAAILITYSWTIVQLARGPWQTEQDGHGPLIIAASLWAFWSIRNEVRRTEQRPAPILGWACLLLGLAILFFSRTQDLISMEVFSIIPVLLGCTLLFGGWPFVRLLAFPIGFLMFAVPPPGWIVDGATIPLKVYISNVVVSALYSLGYPIAQNGVVIMIGPFQLLMEDACAGMNSIFALSAIGMFYVYAFRFKSTARALLLLAAIFPITVFANFIRVTVLVLIAYYGGVGLIEGVLHDLTGILLFAVALILLLIWDGILGLLSVIWRRMAGGAVNGASGS